MTIPQSTFAAICVALICAWTNPAQAQIVGEYQGWLFETGLFEDDFVSEEYCFGELEITFENDQTWDADGDDEVCWGRVTTPSSRFFQNFNANTESLLGSEDYMLRSTRPLVNAGGNLYELFGEEVENNIGFGEERLATVLATPSDANLLVAGRYDSFVRESYTNVSVLVRSTPSIRDARVSADLAGTSWRLGQKERTLVRGADPSQEYATSSIVNLDLLANGACTFSPSAVFPGSVGNFNLYEVLQYDDNDTLSDRGVNALIGEFAVSSCSYSIDADKYLALTLTVSSMDLPPDPFQLELRYVLSDDNRYFAAAQSTTDIDDDPESLQLGFRAANSVMPSLIDGTYLFYFIVTEFEATGLLSPSMKTGFQESELSGRGRFVFDSNTPGTVPAGETGSWFSCSIDMVANEFDLGYTGALSTASVTPSVDDDAQQMTLTSCDYRLLSDGTLSVYFTNQEPGQPTDSAILHGYVNDNGEVLALAYGEGDPDLADDEILNEKGGAWFFLAVEYSGDPDADADNDSLSNYEEFQFPLPPPPPDSDSDGIPDNEDNCPQNFNPDQLDTELDGIGNVCDDDDDNDGIPDVSDAFPLGFADVPNGAFAFSFIETLAISGITAGCGNGNYCPNDPVTRAQMAVFLERGINGAGYSPPPATGMVFNDVAANSFAAAFIEQFFADGITSGCGGGNYCPNDAVTRAQMAVFLLRAKYGSNFQPPPATGIFNDVPANGFAADWIERLFAEGITSGCGNDNYCPNDPVTRAQMAVFIVRTFGL